MSDLIGLVKELWAEDEHLRGNPPATADHILSTYSGRELTRLITPDLREMIKQVIRSRTRDFALTHAVMAGASRPHEGFDGGPLDVEAENISDTNLAARIYVPGSGRILVSELTADHCILIATYQRRLSIMHSATADRFESWAKEITDAGVKTLGELKTGGQSTSETHPLHAAAAAAR